MFSKKYEYKLAFISSTSIYGKSLQFDRLKQLKFSQKFLRVISKIKFNKIKTLLDFIHIAKSPPE